MKTKLYFLSVIAILLKPIALTAQHTNILITNLQQPEEVTIAISPVNLLNVVSAQNMQSLNHSHDGGYTWERETMTSMYGLAGDPVIIIDTLGYVYYFHLSSSYTVPYNTVVDWLDRIVCQRSLDEGRTWDPGVGIGLNGTKDQDKPWACVNRTNNDLYVTWTQFDEYGSADTSKKSNILFSKTSDRGITWSTPLQLNHVSGDCIDDDNTTEGAVPCDGPEGQIYVSWAGPSGLVFNRSLDYGETWLDNEIFIDSLPGGWAFDIPGIARCSGMPVTCCDISHSPYRGSIYVNWSDQRNGIDDTDIWFKKSTDGGNTWSEKKRINNDPPGKQQFFPWMTVDNVTGYIWLIFYDKRDCIDYQTDVYCAVSKDGGETFSDFKINEQSINLAGNIFIGDYINISAVNNVVRPIWTSIINHYLTVVTAIIDTLYTPVEKLVEEKNNAAVYPNPFTESTWFTYKINIPKILTLQVLDLQGNMIKTIFENKFIEAGRHYEHFDPSSMNLASGVYYFRLLGNDFYVSSKIVHIK